MVDLMQKLRAQSTAPAPAPAAPAPPAPPASPLDEEEPDDDVEDEDWEYEAPAPQWVPPRVDMPEDDEVAPVQIGRPIGANARHQITYRAAQYQQRRVIVSRARHNRNKERRAALEARLGAKLPWPCTTKKYLDLAESMIERGYSPNRIRHIIMAEKDSA
jgi:hypothetical protein